MEICVLDLPKSLHHWCHSCQTNSATEVARMDKVCSRRNTEKGKRILTEVVWLECCKAKSYLERDICLHKKKKIKSRKV